MPVPSTRQVVVGAAVSIVLKADQRTGHEVQGVVKDILTRGDHPRGIKVRLADGRIGRVQRMDTGNSSRPSQATTDDGNSQTFVSERGREHLLPAVETTAPAPRFSGQRGKYRDVRLDEPLDAPAEQIDLGAYIVAPKRKGQGRKPRPADKEPEDRPAQAEDAAANVTSATVACPVCSTFEGDEAAVAHHVAAHFE